MTSAGLTSALGSVLGSGLTSTGLTTSLAGSLASTAGVSFAGVSSTSSLRSSTSSSADSSKAMVIPGSSAEAGGASCSVSAVFVAIGSPCSGRFLRGAAPGTQRLLGALHPWWGNRPHRRCGFPARPAHKAKRPEHSLRASRASGRPVVKESVAQSQGGRPAYQSVTLHHARLSLQENS